MKLDQTDGMHEMADPLHGIFPDRVGDDWIDTNDTFCTVCGVPVGVIVSDREIFLYRLAWPVIQAPVLELEKEKYQWC